MTEAATTATTATTAPAAETAAAATTAATTTTTASTTTDKAAETKTAATTQQQTSTDTNTLLADGKAETKVEAKTETKKEDGKAEGSEAKAETVKLAPEKYEFKAPEGVNFEPDTAKAFSEVARELDLTQEAAQKVLDKMGPAMKAQQVEVLKQVTNTWHQQSLTDKEFGGEKYAENLATAKRAVDAYASPALVQLLKESGLQKHPEVIRFFYKAGQSISADNKFVGGSGPTPEQTLSDRLYPTQNKQ
jgi:hypothetical protein